MPNIFSNDAPKTLNAGKVKVANLNAGIRAKIEHSSSYKKLNEQDIRMPDFAKIAIKGQETYK